MLFDTPVQDRQAMPSFGGQTLIVARRTGLLLSVEEGVGNDEVSAYNDLSGTQTVTFNDIRKYSAVLMAFPIRAAVQPYLGVGWGIMHTVSPQTTGGFQSDAEDLGSSGFGTFLAGLTFQVGRLMAFGQYQITTSPGQRLRDRPDRRGGRLRPPAPGSDAHLQRRPSVRPRRARKSRSRPAATSRLITGTKQKRAA